jgi:hypothetical protein
MHFQRFLISVLLLAAFAIPASASTIIYCNSGCGTNNETAFNNAIASQSLFFPNGLENFSTDATGTDTGGLLNANGITGLNFFGYFNTGGGSASQVGVVVSGNNLEQNPVDVGTDTALEVQPPGGIYAFGANVTVVSSSGNPCVEPGVTTSTFNNSNCDAQFPITSSSDTEFFGVISNAPLSNVFIGYPAIGNDGQLEIQSFELGEQTPEAATLLLIGTGLTFLGVLRRRRDRRASSRPSSKICRRETWVKLAAAR